MPRPSLFSADLIELERITAEVVADWCPPLPLPMLRLSARLTRSAGTYRPPSTITVSRLFLEQHGLAASIPILLHELAHHAVHHTVAGRVLPHGREFHAAAARLNAPRYAPFFAAPRTIHRYECPACGQIIDRARRTPRARRYSCARCAPRYEERYRLRYIGATRIE